MILYAWCGRRMKPTALLKDIVYFCVCFSEFGGLKPKGFIYRKLFWCTFKITHQNLLWIDTNYGCAHVYVFWWLANIWLICTWRSKTNESETDNEVEFEIESKNLTQNERAAWATLFLVFSKRERAEWRAQFWISTNNKRKRRSTHQKQNETKLVKTADESRRRIQSNRLLLTPFAIDSLAVQFDGGRVASSADYGGTTWNYGQIPGYFSVVSAIWWSTYNKNSELRKTLHNSHANQTWNSNVLVNKWNIYGSTCRRIEYLYFYMGPIPIRCWLLLPTINYYTMPNISAEPTYQGFATEIYHC